MAIDFPSSPVTNQQYTYAGKTYVFSAQGQWVPTGGGAYTASSTAPSSPNPGDHWYDLSTGVLSIYVNDGTSSQWVMVSPGGGGTATPGPPQGRLSLTINTPVMTASAANQTVIYYIAHVGSMVPFYDGTTWTMRAISSDQISVSTTDTTQNPAAIGASKVNDWFIWWNGSLTKLSHGPDWTNDTTRSAGTALVRVNGIWLNNAAITNGPAAQRGTYVGTTRSNASSQLDWILGFSAAGGGAAFFGVWNCYNRRMVATTVRDANVNWLTSGAVWKPAGVGPGQMRASFVVGLPEVFIMAEYSGTANVAGTDASFGVGVDTTSAVMGTVGYVYSVVSSLLDGAGRYAGPIDIGFHYANGVEWIQTPNTTMFGSQGAYLQNGLTFQAEM